MGYYDSILIIGWIVIMAQLAVVGLMYNY